MYDGPWSDKDPVWTEELLAKVEYTTKNDGVFFMNVKDFRKGFVHFSVLRYDENWKRTQWRSELQKGYAIAIKFDNPVDQEVNFVFDGFNIRMFDGMYACASYNDYQIVKLFSEFTSTTKTVQ